MSAEATVSTTSSQYAEDRRFSRLPTDFMVHLRTNELRVNDRANDISEAGVKIVTSRPLPPKSLVSIRLDLPHGVEPVELLGRVMWSAENTMGIRFEQTDPRVTDVVFRIRQDYERI